jgi:Na+-driven multidrug efflux pump
MFFFMFLAGRLGGKVQAAYTIGLRLEMLPIMVAFPIANACATLVGQNLGARDPERAWRAIRATFGLQALLLWPAALAMFLLRERLVSLFGRRRGRALAASTWSSSIVLGFYGFYFTAFQRAPGRRGHALADADLDRPGSAWACPSAGAGLQADLGHRHVDREPDLRD